MTEAAFARQSGAAADGRAARAHEHFVRFYDDDSALLEAVEGYIGAGLHTGAGAVVIATRPHLEILEDRWQRQGLDLAAAREQGRYQPIDAASAVSRLLVDDRLRADRFTSAIEPAIAAAAQRSSRVIAFGEMVGLLWKEGRRDAAVELEGLWSDLVHKYAFALWCACPRSAPAASDQQRGPAVPPACRAAAPAPRRILVVDDHCDSAESMATLLRLFAHEVVVAFDGPSALELVESFRPEVVLMDIGLPGMNGYEVARTLRASGCAARLVALTGYGQPEDSQRALRAGFDEHFVKPVDLALVQRTLAQAPRGRPGCPERPRDHVDGVEPTSA